MRTALALVLVLSLSAPAVAGIDEGLVTSVDGKGGLVVLTSKGLFSLNAHRDLMADELEFKSKRFPHLYREVKLGDQILLDWYRDAKSGKHIIRGIGIKRRGG